MTHTMILAFIGLAGAISGVVATWGKELSPSWYPILLAVFTIPCVWLGGRLYIRHKKN